jgi:hypothetical protein
VALTNWVGIVAALTSTSDCAVKLRPVTTICVGPAPSSTVDGVIDSTVGRGGVTVNAFATTISPASTCSDSDETPGAALAAAVTCRSTLVAEAPASGVTDKPCPLQAADVRPVRRVPATEMVTVWPCSMVARLRDVTVGATPTATVPDCTT